MKFSKKAPNFLCKNEPKNAHQNYIKNKMPKNRTVPTHFARSRLKNYAKESSLHGAILKNSRCSK